MNSQPTGVVRNKKQLVHYTKTVDAVVSILTNGFLLVPSPRGLIHQFLGSDLFREREPQQFGMTCFTEIPIDQAETHREQFGNFGIGVTWDWALRHSAQRVIYVSEHGPLAEAFAFLFGRALLEMNAEVAKYPDDGARLWGYANAAFASAFGCSMWATMLKLYEYMQPEAQSSQFEWRIVQTFPYHFRADISDRDGLRREALQIANMWRFTALSLEPRDVSMLICPKQEALALQSQLPNAFSAVPVVSATT